MKIKTRLAVAFIIITVFPLIMIYFSVLALSDYQEKSFKKAYGLTEQVDLLNGNSLQVFNRLTKQSQKEIRRTLDENPDNYEDKAYLDKVNAKLNEQYSYLIVRRDDAIIYYGANSASEESQENTLCSQLPDFDVMKGGMEGGIYLDGESQHLIKQMDFRFSDGAEGSAFIVSNVDDLLPEVRSMVKETYRTRSTVTRQTDDAYVMSKIFTSELRAQSNFVSFCQNFFFQFDVAECTAIFVSSSRQVIIEMSRSQLHCQ